MRFVEADASVQATATSLKQIAQIRLPVVVYALTGALERLSKVRNAHLDISVRRLT